MGAADVLIRKLELFGNLPATDRMMVDDAVRRPQTYYDAGQVIIRDGEDPRHVQLVLEGVACRSKFLESGRRQVFAFLLPGDLCDSHVFQLDEMDHDLVAMTKCLITTISRDSIILLMQQPAIARAIWISTMIDEATLREWLVNLGQRESEERVGHLFCELHFRMMAIGLASRTSFWFPITQSLLADTMGISVVHANRVLQSLKLKRMMSLAGGVLTIPDIQRLREFCGFRTNYLHPNVNGKREDGIK